MSDLGDLHTLKGLVVKSLTKRIQEDLENETGFLPTDAATLNAAIALLKHNNITSDPKSAEDLSELRDKLKAAQEARRGAGRNVIDMAEGNLAKIREKL